MASRRKTRRSRKPKRKTQRGRGRLIQNPIVSIFRPPLKCKDGSNAPYRSNAYIGKVVKKDAAERTAQIIEMLKSIDPTEEYTIPPLLFCELAPEQTNTNAKNELFTSQNYKFQEIQRFGGISLHKRLEAQEPLADVLLHLKHFFDKLGVFNTQFIHKDLHTDNVVWDGSVYKMIDFETMVARSKIEDQIQEDLEMVHKNNDHLSLENAKKELDTQVDLYMKHFDVMTLTLSLIDDLSMYYMDIPLAQGFRVLIDQQEPIAESVISHYGLKDYAAAFQMLFNELRYST